LQRIIDSRIPYSLLQTPHHNKHNPKEA